MEIKKYKYGGSIWWGLVGIFLFGASIPLMYQKATTNDVGLIINGIIEFGVSGAIIFYWVMFGFSIIATLMSVLVIFDGIFGKQKYLILYEDKISLPYSFLALKVAEVSYKDIKQVKEYQAGTAHVLEMTTAERKFVINRQLMPNKASYEEVKTLIIQKAGYE